MINLDYCPRTDDEAHAAMLLARVAEIGKLYMEMHGAITCSKGEDFDYVLSEINPDSPAAIYHFPNIKKEFERLSIANCHALNFVRNSLMNTIDAFNAACDVVKNDIRSRSKILEEEGWRRTKNKSTGINGWTRAKTFIKDEQEKV